MIDLAKAAEYAAMHLREDTEQVDNMERARFPNGSPVNTKETIQFRRSRLRERALTVQIVETIASDPALSAAVAQKMGAGG
jgi:hypothetical protein